MSEKPTLMLEKSTFRVGDKINFNVGKIYFNEKSIYVVYVDKRSFHKNMH